MPQQGLGWSGRPGESDHGSEVVTGGKLIGCSDAVVTMIKSSVTKTTTKTAWNIKSCLILECKMKVNLFSL